MANIADPPETPTTMPTNTIAVTTPDARAIAEWQYEHVRNLGDDGNPFCQGLIKPAAWIASRVDEITRYGATPTEVAYLKRRRWQ